MTQCRLASTGGSAASVCGSPITSSLGVRPLRVGSTVSTRCLIIKTDHLPSKPVDLGAGSRIIAAETPRRAGFLVYSRESRGRARTTGRSRTQCALHQAGLVLRSQWVVSQKFPIRPAHQPGVLLPFGITVPLSAALWRLHPSAFLEPSQLN